MVISTKLDVENKKALALQKVQELHNNIRKDGFLDQVKDEIISFFEDSKNYVPRTFFYRAFEDFKSQKLDVSIFSLFEHRNDGIWLYFDLEEDKLKFGLRDFDDLKECNRIFIDSISSKKLMEIRNQVRVVDLFELIEPNIDYLNKIDPNSGVPLQDFCKNNLLKISDADKFLQILQKQFFKRKFDKNYNLLIREGFAEIGGFKGVFPFYLSEDFLLGWDYFNNKISTKPDEFLVLDGEDIFGDYKCISQYNVLTPYLEHSKKEFISAPNDYHELPGTISEDAWGSAVAVGKTFGVGTKSTILSYLGYLFDYKIEHEDDLTQKISDLKNLPTLLNYLRNTYPEYFDGDKKLEDSEFGREIKAKCCNVFKELFVDNKCSFDINSLLDAFDEEELPEKALKLLFEALFQVANNNKEQPINVSLFSVEFESKMFDVIYNDLFLDGAKSGCFFKIQILDFKKITDNYSCKALFSQEQRYYSYIVKLFALLSNNPLEVREKICFLNKEIELFNSMAEYGLFGSQSIFFKTTISKFSLI